MIVPPWVSAEGRVIVPLASTAGERAGTVAAVYGPNASGKSNILAAIAAMCDAVQKSHQRWQPSGGAPHEPFLLDAEHRNMPTLFEAELLLEGRRWQYGFQLDKEGVVAEWLYSYPRGRKRILFERKRPYEFYFGKSLTGALSTLRELTRPNSLFLSVGAANNHPDLAKVANWFSSHARFASRADQDVRVRFTAAHLADERVGSRIQRLLTFADLGITRAETQERPVGEEFRSQLQQVMAIIAPERIDVDLDEALDSISYEVLFHHRAGDHEAALRLQQESLGTQTWFALLGPMAMALAFGDTLVVDELDSSLHPQLISRLIQLFHDESVNTGSAQLIFSTHDTSMLGSLVADQPLGRDELWFTEKDSSGATRLYPLTDFHPRKQENLERGYLQGRFGAVPVLPRNSSLGT